MATMSSRQARLAGARPLNSALEVDLDFERAVRPPPQSTEEVTASIEDLIRKRIADHNFDDVPRAALPAPEKRRKTFELSDQKSSKVGAMHPGKPVLDLYLPSKAAPDHLTTTLQLTKKTYAGDCVACTRPMM